MCADCETEADTSSGVAAFKQKLSEPEAKADYDALSDRLKAALFNHFIGLDGN